MPEWFSKIVQEWSVIAGAPISFTTAVIVVIVAVWSIVNWSYSTVLSSKNAQIELLQGRLADYQEKLKGASPDQAANQLARLRAEIEAIKNPPRDDNSVYQRGNRIGVVAGVYIDAPNKRASFDQMTIGGELDQATNIEFRNLILAYTGADGYGQGRQGLAVTTTYNNIRFSIVGNRRD
jgi:hypothetical protein